MSEERLSPELDGTGGGFGKNKGMTVRQMSEQFNQIAADPTMRSFTAVLRISREQVEARGDFGVNQKAVIICGTITLIAAGAYALGQGNTKALAMKVAIAGIAVTAAFAAGYAKSRHHARASLAQERAIRDLTVDTLVRIADEPAFKPKPLDFTRRLYLSEILKKTKRAEPQLTAILDLGEAS
jgi:hypothetical protein